MKLCRGKSVVWTGKAGFSPPTRTAPWFPVDQQLLPNYAPSGFQDLRMGGGGYVTGMAMHDDGTMFCRIDVYGGYIGSTVLGTYWRQVVTNTSMPPAYSNNAPYYQSGIYEVAFGDPNNSNNLWMYYTCAGSLSAVFISSDKGYTWTQTNFPRSTAIANDNFRYICNKRMAVDPHNPNKCYVGIPTYTSPVQTGS